MSSERRFHTDRRASENFSERGLQSLTGQSVHEWRRYVLKELIDNALEAVDETETTPEIGVSLVYANQFSDEPATAIEVCDNGPGIPAARLEQIFGDIEEFGGTKRHYQLPSRGNQGNALMTVLGIQHLVVPETPLKLCSCGTEYAIHVRGGAIETRHAEIEEVGPSDVDGTAISVEFSANWGSHDLAAVVREFVALNPHASFTLREVRGDNVERMTYPAADEPTASHLTLASNATTGKVTWFSFNGFLERLKADARADASLTIAEFIREFKGLSSPTKCEAVLTTVREESRLDDDVTTLDGDGAIRRLFVEREVDKMTAATLYGAMCDETQPFSPDGLDNTIGSVGTDLKRGTVNYAEQHGVANVVDQLQAREAEIGGESVETVHDLAVYYGGGAVVDGDDVLEKSTPFYFELATVPTGIVERDESASGREVFGINQSITYTTPSFGLSVEYDSRTEEHGRIGDAFDDLGQEFVVVANLTCPAIDFHDKGKQSFNTEPFQEVIADVVGKAVRKIERDIRPALNRLRANAQRFAEPEPTLPNKAHHGFIKEFFDENIEAAYEAASGGGKYTVTQRQLFYEFRPMFRNEAERLGYEYKNDASPQNPEPLTLEYETFTDYLQKYETEVLGERLAFRDDRGFFVEPHSNQQIDLGTAAVKRYAAKADEYGALLFVEKTGFYELLHKDFELSKRYDVGIVNAQGFSTNALRVLVEKIQAETDATLYTLTDLDIGGLAIAANAAETDALSVGEQLDTERIGVTLEDVDAYDLPIEPADYEEKDRSRLETLVAAGDVDQETAEFLVADDGQRVEINAFHPEALGEYLVDKFEEFGIEKLRPEDETQVDVPELDETPASIREDAVSQAVGRYVLGQIEDDIETRVMESADLPAGEELDGIEGDVREKIYADICERVADNPPESWTDINDELAEAYQQEAERERDEYSEAVDQAAYSHLEDIVESIEIRFVTDR